MRPSRELIKTPGLKYLEFYGMRIIRMYIGMKIMFFVMGILPIVGAIITFSIGVFDEYIPWFNWMLLGLGIFLILWAIVMTLVLPSRRLYNKVRDLRDRNAVEELKTMAYQPGAKSAFAIYALVDLGEINPTQMNMYGRRRYSSIGQSGFD